MSDGSITFQRRDRKPPFAEKLNMDGLSDDAKAIAGCWFAKMGANSDGLTLHLRELKPAPRTQAALDELVNWGAISRAPFNRYGGLVYKPLVDCFDAFRWFMENAERPEVNFRLMVPIATTPPTEECDMADTDLLGAEKALGRGARKALMAMTGDFQFPGKATFNANGAHALHWARGVGGRGALCEYSNLRDGKYVRTAYRLTSDGMAVQAALRARLSIGDV